MFLLDLFFFFLLCFFLNFAQIAQKQMIGRIQFAQMHGLLVEYTRACQHSSVVNWPLCVSGCCRIKFLDQTKNLEKKFT